MKKHLNFKRAKYIFAATALICASILIPTSNTYATISSAHGSYTNFVIYVRTDREPYIRMNTGDSWSDFNSFAIDEFNEKYYIPNISGINFSSSNTNVVTVDSNGTLHANSAGSATVTGEATYLSNIRNVEINVTVTDYTLTVPSDIYLAADSSTSFSATTDAESLSASAAEGVSIAAGSNNTFTVSAANPGNYTATITAIAVGGAASNISKTVNVHVYGLEATSNQDGAILRAGETFNYTINEEKTNGTTEATMRRNGEIVNNTNEEGSYTMTIVNAEAGEHGIDQSITFNFTIVQPIEEQTVSVIAGNPLSNDILSTNSIWGTDYANDATTNTELPIVDGIPQFNTDSDITTHELTLGHTFASGKTALKNLIINIYRMIAPSDNTYSGELDENGQFVTNLRVSDINGEAIITNNSDEIENLTVDENIVTITKAGEYTLTYTDRAADGTEIGTFTATFTISEPQPSMGSDESTGTEENTKTAVTATSPDTGRNTQIFTEKAKAVSAKYTASSVVTLATFVTLFGAAWFAKKREEN